jgi:hypothetical protein
MALWGKTDAAAYAPKNKIIVNASVARGNTRFANTTTGSVNVGVGPQRVSLVGANTAEAHTVRKASPGWILKREFTGPVKTLAPNAGGTTYSNNDLVVISGGTTNATASISTNATGGILTTTLTNVGAGFINVANTSVAVTNATGGASTGSTATFTFTLGGKAGRVLREQLVAMSGAGGGVANGAGSTLT